MIQSTPLESTAANPPIRTETLKRIHEIFLESIYTVNTEMDFLKKFLDLLSNESVPEEEARFWGIFVDGVRHCYRLHIHKRTFRRSAQNLALCIQKIIDWINEDLPESEKLRLQIFVRQKGIFMHLMKVLKKSLKCDYEERMESACIDDASSNIHDFIGILGIILNKFNTEEYIYHPQLDRVYKSVRDIISGQNTRAKEEFLDWMNNSEEDSSVKSIVTMILNTPFNTIRFKNYVKKPKTNGYRTFQWTFVQSAYSTDRPGSEVEIQVRDIKMHQNAVGNHRDYKGLSKPEFGGLDLQVLASVFHIDDFKKVNIDGFAKYDEEDQPINPEDVYLDREDITHVEDSYGFAVPVVIETLTV